jgi:TetR/AcrR family transcriptional repressor of nem operon
MNDLAVACGLMKGSFYHYFESKETLMEAVLLYVADAMDKKVFVCANLKELSPKQRLEKMLYRLGKSLLNNEGGCIIGNTTLETCLHIPKFRDISKRIFDNWINAQTQIYAHVHPPETARLLAQQTVMEFEGAVMMAKLYNDIQFYKDCYNRALERLEVE